MQRAAELQHHRIDFRQWESSSDSKHTERILTVTEEEQQDRNCTTREKASREVFTVHCQCENERQIHCAVKELITWDCRCWRSDSAAQW